MEKEPDRWKAEDLTILSDHRKQFVKAYREELYNGQQHNCFKIKGSYENINILHHGAHLLINIFGSKDCQNFTMQQQERDKITKNCSKFLSTINWLEILPKLVAHGIYTYDHLVVQQWQKNPEHEENTRQLYLDIRRCGPTAFQSFVQCLREIGREDLAEILQYDESINTVEIKEKIVHVVNKRNLEVGSKILQSKESSNEVKAKEEVVVEINKKKLEVNTEISQSNCKKSSDEVKAEERIVVVNKEELQVNTEPLINELSDDSYDKYYNQLQTAMKPLKVSVIKSTRIMNSVQCELPSYDMCSNPRGIVLIINNIKFLHTYSERLGAEHDHNNLRDLFEQMGFKVLPICENLTSEEMEEKIRKFANRDDLQRVDSLFLIVMSHGIHDSVDGVDNKSLKIKNILELFSSSNCPKMIGKPRVFIFQACRGENKQYMISNQENTDLDQFLRSKRTVSDANLSQPAMEEEFSKMLQEREFSDMFVAHATMFGYEALRDIEVGSWYIQILCEVFMNHAHETELLRLFQMKVLYQFVSEQQLSKLSDLEAIAA